MLELTINDQVYEFNFGLGFVKEIDKTVTAPVPGNPGVTQNVGLNYLIAKIMGGDVVALADALLLANRGFKPRVTQALIEAYIDDEDTDIDELFDMVLDFFARSNAIKKTYEALKAEMEAMEAEAAK